MFIADHTCLRVSDLEKEQQFYEEALHFFKVEERQHKNGVSMVFLADEMNRYRLQLISGMKNMDSGFGHIAVISDDFENDYLHHKRMGCLKSDIINLKNQRSYFIADPTGYEIEVLTAIKKM